MAHQAVGLTPRSQILMTRNKPAPAAKPPVPAQRSAPEARAMLARVMLRVAEKHGDDAMRAAGERLAKAAKGGQR
jgi:hypothetical protein